MLGRTGACGDPGGGGSPNERFVCNDGIKKEIETTTCIFWGFVVSSLGA